MSTAYSQRAPLSSAASAGLTIQEIERQVEALRANWPDDAEVRDLALLFAILREGSSVQKLAWFTKYDRAFIVECVEELRQRGKLFTGTLTPQFVLSYLPGSEDLIEQITGARPVAPSPIQPAFVASSAKRVPREPSTNNGSQEPQKPAGLVDSLSCQILEGASMSKSSTDTVGAPCLRDPNCIKAAKHLGNCRIVGSNPQKKNKAAATVKPESAGTFYFTVFCKVEGEEYKAEGASHLKLQSALATIDRMLGGVN